MARSTERHRLNRTKRFARASGLAWKVLLATALTTTSAVAQEVPVAPGAQMETMARMEAMAEASAPAASSTFDILDNVEGAHADLVAAPIRPLVQVDGWRHVYVLNSHDSTVRHYDFSAPGKDVVAEITRRFLPENERAPSQPILPAHVWPVPWGPVSIAYRVPPEDGRPEELLVVCKGNHVLARLNARTGAIIGLVDLPSEPADILVDQTSQSVFVSCQGADKVVRIHLADLTTTEYMIPAKHPTFLSWDGDAVLVAPMFSGNNTMVDKPDGLLIEAGARGIVDLSRTPTSANLPDDDLFRIDPRAGTVEAVLTGTGTVLFAHRTSPRDGKLWQLNTDARNTIVGEPALRGRFAANRITIADLRYPDGPHQVIDLDFLTEEGAPRPGWKPVAQPCALDFSSQGYAVVVGLGSSIITVLAPGGVPLFQWDIPEGTIPRAVYILSDEDDIPVYVAVYCWGTNTIEVFNLFASPPARLDPPVSLGFDPTPRDLREGRDLFYSGAHSRYGNLSCNTCHVNGGWDMLPWFLSDPPRDHKGPLMTQSLLGINGLEPFHWRGEQRSLKDFNGAFEALLGGEKLSDEEFEKFQRYIFSLRNPANPNEDERRILNDAIVDIDCSQTGEIQGSAIEGQPLFRVACAGCHTLPTGTNHDILRVEPGTLHPEAAWFKVAPLVTGVWRKEQCDRFEIFFFDEEAENERTEWSVRAPEADVVPTLGAAVAAAGTINSMLDFVTLFRFSEARTRNITAFIHQLDSGLAPAVHKSVLLNARTAGWAGDRLREYLLPQVESRHCDLAVFGTVTLDPARGPVELRWFWDRYLRRFVPESRELPSRHLGFFLRQAASGQGSNTFVGLPVGMAERFAVDYDEDGIYNLDEVPGSEYHAGPVPPRVAPTIRYTRLQWHTTRVAKINLDTGSYTRIVATAVPVPSATTLALEAGIRPVAPETTPRPVGERISVSDRFARTHEIFFKDLTPDTEYEVTIRATNRAGITGEPATFSLTTLPISEVGQVPTDLHLENVAVTRDAAGGAYSMTFDLASTIVEKGTGQPWVHPQGGEGAKMLTQILVGGEVVVDPLVYLRSAIPSDENGRAVIPGITLDDLLPGDEICVDMFSFLWTFEVNGQQRASFTHFCFPLTAPENRELRFRFCPERGAEAICLPEAE